MTGDYGTPAEWIAEYLIAMGAGNIHTADDWPVFVGNLVDKPNNLIAVFDTDAKLNPRILPGSIVSEHPGIQIIIRATEYTEGFQKALLIRNILDELLRFTTTTSTSTSTTSTSTTSTTTSTTGTTTSTTTTTTSTSTTHTTFPPLCISNFMRTTGIMFMGSGGDSQRRFQWSINGRFSWQEMNQRAVT